MNTPFDVLLMCCDVNCAFVVVGHVLSANDARRERGEKKDVCIRNGSDLMLRCESEMQECVLELLEHTRLDVDACSIV